jgi:shikimate kinase
MNLVLIGYRAAGKTTLAKTLGETMGWPVVQIDRLIAEKSDVSLKVLVKKKGWNYFRKLEKETIRAVSKKDQIIIDAGGGAVLNRLSAKRLKKNGVFVYLKAAPSVLRRRLAAGRSRPALTSAGLLDEIPATLAQRSARYQALADLEIDTGKTSPARARRRIFKYLSAGGLLK